MICPKCSTLCRETDRFCYLCGAPLSQPKAFKSGKLLPPVLILLCLTIIGTILFFAIPLSEPIPQISWFQVADGTLHFDPALYDGPAELEIPETVNGQTVTAIADRCFADCDYLTTVILPNTVKTIGDGAFSNCINLRGIYLPEGMTEIGKEAFLHCTNLEAICIPASVQRIGKDAFTGCSELYYILYDGEFTTWRLLYHSHINLHTHVYCTDGDYLHR